MRRLLTLSFRGLSLAAVAVAAGGVSGCSMMPYYSQLKAVADTGIEAGIQDRRDFNDKKAELIKVVAGEVTRGAMLRNYTPDEQCAIDTLILGSPPANCQAMDRLAIAIEKLANPAAP